MAEVPMRAGAFSRELNYWGTVEFPRQVKEFGTVVGMVAWRVAKQRAAVLTGAMKGNIYAWNNSIPLDFNPREVDRSPKGSLGRGENQARARLERRKFHQPFGIVSKAFYSEIIELGAPGRPPQPFLRPAAEAADRLVMTSSQIPAGT